ncbi:HIT domain-containing protein [archaeon]|nr:HIT domain-containing protein [archaeon]
MAEEKNKCLFCGIVDGSVPSLKVYEGKNVVGVLSIKPATKGHVLIIPKNHQAYLHTLDPESLFEVMSAIRSVTLLLSQTFNPEGFNVINNMGPGAGQKLPHVCFEVIPRYKGDGVKVEIPQGEFKEQELMKVQEQVLTTSKTNTIKTLKAIKEGKVKASPEVKAEAEKALAQLEQAENPVKTAKKQYSTKLENILDKEE